MKKQQDLDTNPIKQMDTQKLRQLYDDLRTQAGSIYLLFEILKYLRKITIEQQIYRDFSSDIEKSAIQHATALGRIQTLNMVIDGILKELDYELSRRKKKSVK